MKPGALVRWRGSLYQVETVGDECRIESIDKPGWSWLAKADELEVVKTKVAALRVEVCRSFSYKLNVANIGGPQYESRDFFCSQKAECSIDDAPEVGAALYAFCRSQVMQSVKEYMIDLEAQRAKRQADLEADAARNGIEEPYQFNERAVARRNNKR